MAALTLPVLTGPLVGRLAARDKRPASSGPIGQGTLAATCAMASAALVVSVLTVVTIALFPRHVPLEGTAAPWALIIDMDDPPPTTFARAPWSTVVHLAPATPQGSGWWQLPQ